MKINKILALLAIQTIVNGISLQAMLVGDPEMDYPPIPRCTKQIEVPMSVLTQSLWKAKQAKRIKKSIKKVANNGTTASSSKPKTDEVD